MLKSAEHSTMIILTLKITLEEESERNGVSKNNKQQP